MFVTVKATGARELWRVDAESLHGLARRASIRLTRRQLSVPETGSCLPERLEERSCSFNDEVFDGVDEAGGRHRCNIRLWFFDTFVQYRIVSIFSSIRCSPSYRRLAG
jgi:hypothetical protein